VKESSRQIQIMHLCKAIALLLQCSFVVSDFSYVDFNKTTGLVFNGAAMSTDCNEASEFVNKDQDETEDNPKINQYGLTATNDLLTTVETARNNSANDTIDLYEAVFNHRDEFAVGLTSGCSNRLRLTSSNPSKAGSVWYQSRVPILRGFETTFTFQITDQSVECIDHVDSAYSTKQHRSCAVHGGDGFAFVIHGSPQDERALGGDGEQLGYGGIVNSIAVEFDTWTNVDTQGSDDVFTDHISIHSAGPLLANSANQSAALGYWRQTNIADGKVHNARVQYLPYVETRYFELMTANEQLIPYLKDNGEGRRIGTLAVFVDQGIPEDRPLLAIPINLSLVLNATQSLAYVGFTASTGRKWQTHDILSWDWCHSEDCQGDPNKRVKFEVNQ
jgi:hypothetical protein